MATMDDIEDPTLQRMLAHLPEKFDLLLVTLKGHLLIEEQLDNYISEHLRKPEAMPVARLPFELKIKLAHALSGPLPPPSMWEALNILNKLRNSLAHRIEDPRLTSLVRDFVNISEREGWLTYADGNMDDKFLYSIVHYIGFLAPEYKPGGNSASARDSPNESVWDRTNEKPRS